MTKVDRSEVLDGRRSAVSSNGVREPDLEVLARRALEVDVFLVLGPSVEGAPPSKGEGVHHVEDSRSEVCLVSKHLLVFAEPLDEGDLIFDLEPLAHMTWLSLFCHGPPILISLALLVLLLVISDSLFLLGRFHLTRGRLRGRN